MNKIGYACITLGIKEKYRTCRLSNLSSSLLEEIINHNLNILDKVIDYNIENNIKLFRISSDIIPFGSLKECIDYKNIFKNKLEEIGKKIKKNNIRVSMHPGQYTVINSNKEEVVSKSIKDLIYHCDFLDSLGTNSSSKIILHIGGVYGNKEEAVERFIFNYNKLNSNIKKRLVIENDDKSYNIFDVLKISSITNIPVVFDNLHNKINKYNDESDLYWINLCNKTWVIKDGNQKIHYSIQDINKKKGSHSETIDEIEFLKYYNSIKHLNIDIMLEVKDKDISAIKCINYLKEGNFK